MFSIPFLYPFNKPHLREAPHMAHFSYLDNKMKNTSISLFQSIFMIHKLFVFATLCVPLVCWWRRQWGWITRPFHGSPTIGSGQTSDQLLHMPHKCHFYWPIYTNLILPHICHFYDDEIISWEPPYWIRPNIWPSSTHASYLSLFRWGQNKGEAISVYWMFAATIDQHLHWIVTYIQK